MNVAPPVFLHPDQVDIDSRRYKPHKTGDSSILLTGSGVLFIKNRCKRRRLIRVYLAVYDYESIHQFDDFLLCVAKRTTTMIPFEHPNLRPLSIHIYYPGLKRGLRVCVLSRTPYHDDET